MIIKEIALITAGAASDDLKFEAIPDTDVTTFPLRICTARIYDVSPIISIHLSSSSHLKRISIPHIHEKIGG